jgi:hypothetical protein
MDAIKSVLKERWGRKAGRNIKAVERSFDTIKRVY